MTTLASHVDVFGEKDLTVRIVSGLMTVLPFAPAWKHPGSLLSQCGSPRALELAELAAQRDGVQRALTVFELLDKADTGIALFSGVRGAVKAVRGQDGAWEVDPQQGLDAALKVLGVSWAAYALFEGDVARLGQTKAGRALLAWFAAADLVLPFADNAAEGGVGLFTGVIDKYSPAAADKLATLGGPSADQALGAFAKIKDSVGTLAAQATVAAGPMSEWAKGSLPGVIGMADSITGAVATALDTLGAYRYLGGALVAEVVVPEARATEAAEIEAAAKAAEASRKAAEEAERAEAEARQQAEEAERARSAVQTSYQLGGAHAAASLDSAPIKVTRGAEIEAQANQPVAKAGCFGCGSLFLLAIGLGAAGSAYALV